jgi:hypothetical protein
LPHLTHLVHLGLISLTLQIDQFSHAGPPENVAATANPFLETQPPEQLPHLIEVDVRIGPRLEDATPEFVKPAHGH